MNPFARKGWVSANSMKSLFNDLFHGNFGVILTRAWTSWKVSFMWFSLIKFLYFPMFCPNAPFYTVKAFLFVCTPFQFVGRGIPRNQNLIWKFPMNRFARKGWVSANSMKSLFNDLFHRNFGVILIRIWTSWKVSFMSFSLVKFLYFFNALSKRSILQFPVKAFLAIRMYSLHSIL
jgi:hypothetical protein